MTGERRFQKRVIPAPGMLLVWVGLVRLLPLVRGQVGLRRSAGGLSLGPDVSANVEECKCSRPVWH